MKKRILYGLLILAALAVGYGVYLFNKKPADIREEKPDFEISAADLVKAFNESDSLANLKFVDKVILVSGKISAIDQAAASVSLDAGDPMASVTCSFYADEAPSLSKIKIGDAITIKGKCTGKLMDVVLNECSLDTNSKH